MYRVLACVAAVFLTACATEEQQDAIGKSLGQFRLGHNIAIAETVERSPLAAGISNTALEAEVQRAVGAQLRPYDGDGLYHLGLVVDSLVLPQPGVPVVYSTQSKLVVDVTVFDNDTGSKLNQTPERFQVGGGFETVVPFLGSGNVRPVEQQLEALTTSLARDIETWLRQNSDWFAPRPDQLRVPYDFRVQAPEISDLSGL